MIPLLCIIPAALIVLAAIEAPAVAWVIGRLKRRARSYTNLMTSLPPVPTPKSKRDDDADWFASWACDTPLDVIERAYWHREFLAIPEVAQDMRDAR